MIEKNKILLADCMDIMAQMPDKYIDLSICDPPYGIGIDGQKENIKGKKSDRKKHAFKNWDNKIPEEKYFNELFRVSKNSIIWGGNYFVKHFTEGHKGWIIWDKAQHGLTMSDCELAYSSFDCPTRILTLNRSALLHDRTIHPTQKPLSLYRWILQNYAKPNDLIFDSHSGSGSCAIACLLEKHDFIACELDEDYHKDSVNRFDEYKSQGVLF